MHTETPSYSTSTTSQVGSKLPLIQTMCLEHLLCCITHGGWQREFKNCLSLSLIIASYFVHCHWSYLALYVAYVLLNISPLHVYVFAWDGEKHNSNYLVWIVHMKKHKIILTSRGLNMNTWNDFTNILRVESGCHKVMGTNSTSTFIHVINCNCLIVHSLALKLIMWLAPAPVLSWHQFTTPDWE